MIPYIHVKEHVTHCLGQLEIMCRDGEPDLCHKPVVVGGRVSRVYSNPFDVMVHFDDGTGAACAHVNPEELVGGQISEGDIVVFEGYLDAVKRNGSITLHIHPYQCFTLSRSRSTVS